MSTDIIADTMNQIMNARRANKKTIRTTRFSKLLLNVLEIMKKQEYIDYRVEGNHLIINIISVTECKAIKPRYSVNMKNIDKYIRRFLPSRNFGYVVVSTNKGLMLHPEALEKKIGGSLIAFFY